jgi:hypothetical protein
VEGGQAERDLECLTRPRVEDHDERLALLGSSPVDGELSAEPVEGEWNGPAGEIGEAAP